MRFGKGLFVILWFGLLAGCGEVVIDDEVVDDEEPADNHVTLGESESRWSFELPGEGTPNDGDPIGPFCCTGETAVVESDDGSELGYGYFFDWKGQAYNTSTGSIAPDVAILVAGSLDIETPSKLMAKGEIAFMADELIAGSSRSAQAGDLLFTVTVVQADLRDGPDGVVFEMGSLAVRLDVDPVETE